jgi:hypothetical protein
MQPWLRNSIVATVASIAVLSVGWVGICSFWVGPQIFQAAMAGRLKTEPTVCNDADSRALQVLTGLLATLISLGSTVNSDR